MTADRSPAAVAALLAGLVISALLGPGLLAVTTDQVVIEGNVIASDALGGSGDVDLLVGTSTEGQCDEATYADTISGLGFVVFAEEARDFGIAYPTPATVCIRNDGTSAANVGALLLVSRDVEDGECQLTEAAAGDLTCEDGAPGELAAEVQVLVSNDCSAGEPSRQQGLAEEVPAYPLGVLEPGEECRLILEASVTDDEVERWQTDIAEFDIVLDAEGA